MALWTIDELRTLGTETYFPVLRAQLAGSAVVKAEYLRRGEAALPGRTHHTIKDRCYRVSEVLRDADLPWVRGWNPPDMVGQSANSNGVTALIERALLEIAQREFGNRI